MQSHIKKTLGQNLRKFRHQANLTLKELSALTGIGSDLLSEVETGKVFPKVANLARLVEALKIEKLAYLFDEEPYVPTKPHKYTYAAPILRASKRRTPK